MIGYYQILECPLTDYLSSIPPPSHLHLTSIFSLLSRPTTYCHPTREPDHRE
jgi:hypothetical protein